jgi:Holliday junction resolvase RusA-like endonuclease
VTAPCAAFGHRSLCELPIIRTPSHASTVLPSDAPPEQGLLTIEVPVAPVSLQAGASKKQTITAPLKAAVAPYGFLLSGDVKVAIQWWISAQDRYESDNSADVDNIVKPILDALCGPDGILIDDCQVQELICYWSGGYENPLQQSVKIELQYDPEESVAKEGLIFLQVDRGLYIPMHDDLPPPIPLHQAEAFTRMFTTARQLLDNGASPQTAHQVRPSQRVFHRSKLERFRRTTIEELRARLLLGG